MTLAELKKSLEDTMRVADDGLPGAVAHRIEMDEVELILKLIAVAKAAEGALEDWYAADSSKEVRRALAALENLSNK